MKGIRTAAFVLCGVGGITAAVGCRDMAGGQAVDSLMKAKTAAARAESQMEDRFQQGLRAGTVTDEQIEAATGEKAPGK